jgi:acyl carrier protein
MNCFYKNMQQVQKHLLKEAATQINEDFGKADATTIISRGSCSFDSLDRMEFIMLAEEEFNISLCNTTDEDLTTIGAFVCLVWKAIREKHNDMG